MTLNLLKAIGMKDTLNDALKDVDEMYATCEMMLNEAWQAILNQDDELTDQVIGMDDSIDALEIQVREKVLYYLSSLPAGGNIPLSLILIDTAGHLERLADHTWYLADNGTQYQVKDTADHMQNLGVNHSHAIKMLSKTHETLKTCDENKAHQVIGQQTLLQKQYDLNIQAIDDSTLPAHKTIGLILCNRNLLRIGKKCKSINEYCLKPYPEAGE